MYEKRGVRDCHTEVARMNRKLTEISIKRKFCLCLSLTNSHYIYLIHTSSRISPLAASFASPNATPANPLCRSHLSKCCAVLSTAAVATRAETDAYSTTAAAGVVPVAAPDLVSDMVESPFASI